MDTTDHPHTTAGDDTGDGDTAACHHHLSPAGPHDHDQAPRDHDQTEHPIVLLPTTQLHTGDIVHTEGLHVLLDQPPTTWTHQNREVHFYSGLILNPHNNPHPDPWEPDQRPRHTIQGDHRDHWATTRTT